MNIHEHIENKFEYYLKTDTIPHIIFYGPSGSGKRKLVHQLIKKCYDNNSELIKKYTLFENCALGKGINFIRHNLKEFAKITNFNKYLKLVILYNADKLTYDAQSAMRRCIEQFSITTRFFIILDDINYLLQPIISRFCHIYVPYPKINNKITNLYQTINFNDNIYFIKRKKYLKNKIKTLKKTIDLNQIITLSNIFYNKGYNALDCIEVFNDLNIDNKNKIIYLFNIIKADIRDEVLAISYVLILYYFRSDNSIENSILM